MYIYFEIIIHLTLNIFLKAKIEYFLNKKKGKPKTSFLQHAFLHLKI